MDDTSMKEVKDAKNADPPKVYWRDGNRVIEVGTLIGWDIEEHKPMVSWVQEENTSSRNFGKYKKEQFIILKNKG